MVTLDTLLDRFSEDITPNINIVDNGLKEEFLDELRRYLEKHPKKPFLKIRKMREEYLEPFKAHTAFRKQDQFRPAVLSKLAIPILFPESQFGAYLDCDFFVQKDFSSLLQFENEDVDLLAVRDRFIDKMDSHYEGIDSDLFNTNPVAPYFNAGFFVMNLKRWDRKSYWDKVHEISLKKPMAWEDQSILNIAFCNKWKSLPDSWNRMVWPQYLEYSFPKKDRNYHFFGGQKPWDFSPTVSKGLVPMFFKTYKNIPFNGLKIDHLNRPHGIWWLKNFIFPSFPSKEKI